LTADRCENTTAQYKDQTFDKGNHGELWQEAGLYFDKGKIN